MGCKEVLGSYVSMCIIDLMTSPIVVCVIIIISMAMFHCMHQNVPLYLLGLEFYLSFSYQNGEEKNGWRRNVEE